MTLRDRVAGTMLAAVVMSAAAGVQAHSLDGVRFTGPLATPGPGTLPKGESFVQPYWIYTRTDAVYDDSGERQRLKVHGDSELLSTVLSAGIHDKLTGEVLLNSSKASQGAQHSNGYRLGDSTVRLRYQLRGGDALEGKMKLAVMLGQSLATGRYDRLGDNLLNGQGNGAYRSNLSLLGQQYLWLPNERPLRWRWMAAWSPAPQQVSLRGRSVYGTDASFRGKVRPGPGLNAALALEYSINRNWALALDLTASQRSGSQLDGTVLDVAGQRQAVHQHGARSRSFSAAPAVEYIFNDQVGLVVGVQAWLPGGRNSDAYVSPQAAVAVSF